MWQGFAGKPIWVNEHGCETDSINLLNYKLSFRNANTCQTSDPYYLRQLNLTCYTFFLILKTFSKETEIQDR